jgi:probable F420-dependent oxidoreductase
MTARFGIAIPQHFPDGPVEPEAIRRFVTTAESLGFDSLWVGEEILHAPALDPLSLLTFTAAHTSRVRLGTAVLVATLRSPVHFAKEIATLDNLSGGRLTVGIGLGTSTRNYPAFGIAPEHRVRRYLEAITVMRKLWTEDAVTFEGEYWKFRGEHMAPKPVQRPHPPLWFAGRADVALARAARLGDGWIGGKTVLGDFRRDVATLRRFLEEGKRDPAGFPVAKRVYVQLDADKSRVEGRLMEFFGRTYGNPEEAKRAVIYGNAAECADRIAEFVAAGCEVPIFDPIFDRAAQMEALARDVLPALTLK